MTGDPARRTKGMLHKGVVLMFFWNGHPSCGVVACMHPHVAAAIAVISCLGSSAWSHAKTVGELPAPAGYSRTSLDKGSFGQWLRGLKLLKPGTPVRLFDGRLKGNQTAHHAVVDLSIGKRDLQQCADAIIRLRSEYLWDTSQADRIVFKFTNGTPVPWKKWRRGWRTRIKGNRVHWVKRGKVGTSRETFHSYLRTIMMYAGTASLSRDLKRAKLDVLKPGDALIQGGFPGHAVLVLDAATGPDGDQLVLLGQSFMPAQNFHVLRNPRSPSLSPWYRASDLRVGLKTPEWRPFKASDIRTF